MLAFSGLLALGGKLLGFARGIRSDGLPRPSSAAVKSVAVWGLAAIGIVFTLWYWRHIAETGATDRYRAKAAGAVTADLLEEIRVRGHADRAATQARAELALKERQLGRAAGALEAALAEKSALEEKLKGAATPGQKAAHPAPFHTPAIVKGIYQ